GNHPDSKLYQAKEALTTFLDSDQIWVCDEEDGEGNCLQKRYLVNMGFATYMSARVPRVYAKYYRKRAGATTTDPERYYIRGYYKRTNNHSTYEYHPTSNSQFDDDWGGHHTGVTIGYQFDRLYREGQCDEQTITYTVTDIIHSPTDSLPNRYRFNFNGDYVEYSWRNTDVASCVEGPLGVGDLPNLEPNWTVVDVGDPCYANQDPECIYVPETTTTTGDWYQLYTYGDTYGDWSVADPATPRYIDPVTLQVTPYKGHCYGIPGDDWLCDNPDPEPAEGDGDWTLVTEANAKYSVPINANGDLGDIVPNTFDITHFRYPGRTGDADHPHAWSYRKTDQSWVYRYAHSYSSNWGDGIPGQGGFPATVGDEMANSTGDDQVVFVGLPAYDDGDQNKGDDVAGANITKIKNYVSLTRVQHPRHGYENYDLSMMPYTSSIAPNYYTAETGKGTPLAASLLNAKTYYESYFQQDQFTIGDCRKNYVILLTDGLETCDGDPVTAAAALNTQLIGGNPGSVVKTFVIGFGLDEASKANLNAIAAAGGTDQAYFATNVQELVNILANEITSEIIGDSYSRSSPVASRYFQEGDDLRLYYAYFDYPVWKGHLESYELNYDGTLGDPIDGWPGDCDGEPGNDADAGCVMKNMGRGTVYTVADTDTMAAIPFSVANVATLKPLVNPDGEDINENGTADEDADAETVINYTLNPGYDNGSYLGSRDPAWPLGDIYHSAPVIVTKPKFSISYWNGYDAHKAAQASRPTMIYIGANDGMLHAIQDSNGQEAWAYIPNCVLGKLHEFKDGHRFTVDLTIRGAEVDTSDGCDGTGWKAMVVSGLRKGGNHYYALDVTDPANPLPMWEMTDDNMGDTWSIPSFGRIKINNNHTFVIFVGGGLSDTEDKGNRLYIIKAADGTILKEITVGSSTNNIPSEIRVMRHQTNQAGQPIDYSTGATVNSDLKGNIEVAYFGGTDGTLYKLTGLNTQNQWDPQLEVMYRPPAGERRPIYHRPAVADYKSCHKRFILFGTGNESEPTTVTQNYFYEIEDRPWSAAEDEDEYPDGSQGQADGLFRLTWKETLTPIGEEVLSDPTYYYGAVYFTAYQPQGGCDMGLSYLYGITTSTCTETGGDPGLQYDEDGNPLSEDNYEKKQELGKSIATSPVIAPPGMFIGDGEDVIEVPVPSESGILLYWREGN
ncbi:MAG: PilC/PilY family type IV pilus protein, partial [Desulfatiglans sp.]|nr:PilC/PilY family type IV pilus protein [Desulfatiglans sp.]